MKKMIIAVVMVLVFLTGCGRIKTAKELIREAEHSHGDCTVVSKEETEEYTAVVLHDTLQDFDYRVSSRMNSLSIDGATFGTYENTADGFTGALIDKVRSLTEDDILRICDEEGVVCMYDRDPLLIIRSDDEERAVSAALKCAEKIQEYNLQNRLDTFSIICYADEKADYLYDRRYGKVILPEIRWITPEEETTEYYKEMARYKLGDDVEYLGKEVKTFGDTNADMDRVAQPTYQPYPEDDSSPVTFYYFKTPEGDRYILCDFLYYYEDGRTEEWYIEKIG